MFGFAAPAQRLISLSLSLGALSCLPAPPSPVAPVTSRRSVADTYDCVLRTVNQLQYVITNADRSSGFVRAERAQAGGRYVDRLSVSVYRDTTGRTLVRVVPQVASAREVFDGSPDGEKAQQALLHACADTAAAS